MRLGVRTLALIVLSLFVARWSGSQSAAQSYYAAIRANDLPRLQAAVTAGGVEVVDEQGRTPLMHAAAIGTVDAVRLLIAQGAKVNVADSFGVTPLMFGARDLARVRLLLEKGADPNAKTQQGQPALLIAAATPESIDTVRLLVEKGADPKAVGAGGRTGLTVAAMASDLAMVQFFVDRGVDVNAAFRSDKENNTALMVASTQNSAAIARLLLQKGADVNAVTKQNGATRNGTPGNGGVSVLGMAVPYGSPDLIRTLLAAGANPNTRDNRGMTPLMLAVASENQDPEVVKLLLAAGSDPSIKSDVGETALDWGRKYADPDTLALLGGGSERQPMAKAAAPGPVTLPPADALRTMLQESMALLQRSSKQFASQGGCIGCHHQQLTTTATVAARSKGIPVDETVSLDLLRSMAASYRARQTNSVIQRLDGGGLFGTTLYTLAALQSAKYPADEEGTDAAVAYLLARQYLDGHWPHEDISRSPLDDGDFNRTALSVAAIAAYVPPSLKAEAEEHLRRARRWLLETRPRTTDDQAMQVFGLHHSGGAERDVQAAAKALLGLQRPDGGWAPRPYLESDAYATSQALWVLSDTGTLPAADQAYRRGLQFLVNAREKDGSWHVRSRAPKFQPYFESGFPHGHDQWISSAATARAVVVLARSLE